MFKDELRVAVAELLVVCGTGGSALAIMGDMARDNSRIYLPALNAAEKVIALADQLGEVGGCSDGGLIDDAVLLRRISKAIEDTGRVKEFHLYAFGDHYSARILLTTQGRPVEHVQSREDWRLVVTKVLDEFDEAKQDEEERREREDAKG